MYRKVIIETEYWEYDPETISDDSDLPEVDADMLESLPHFYIWTVTNNLPLADSLRKNCDTIVLLWSGNLVDVTFWRQDEVGNRTLPLLVPSIRNSSLRRFDTHISGIAMIGYGFPASDEETVARWTRSGIRFPYLVDDVSVGPMPIRVASIFLSVNGYEHSNH